MASPSVRSLRSRSGRRGAVLVAVVAVVAAVLAGCAGTPSGSPSAGGSSGGSAGGSSASAKDLKVGWSTIYLTPSWMQETQKFLQTRVDQLKSQGVVKNYTVFNANGDTSQQISQIQSMVQQKYDVILVDAGSSTALNSALEDAVDAGITVVNFDSLVTSTKVIKVGTDQQKWGAMMASFIVKKLGGKGNVLVFNGPAGVAVSEDRYAGAKTVFAKSPGIKVVATLNSEYNIAPAAQAFAAAFAAHPNINAVFSQGGALSAGAMQTLVKQKKFIPVTGENYNGFLKTWQKYKPQGFSSLATAQPNYLATIALDAAVAKIRGTSVPTNVVVPLPVIDDSNLAQWVSTSSPDDYYPIKNVSQSEVDKLIGVG